MPGVCVIVAYRPKPGKEAELLEIVRSRVPTLAKEDLVTDRAPVMMRAKDGTIVEVSEWKSREAIEAAGANLLYLPPYSPDLNPIELAFAKFKNGLRKAAERTVDDLWRRIGTLINDFSPQECQNYFCHDGYASS